MADASVVVVGGSSGLGLEVARHYARQGRDVVVTGSAAERELAAEVLDREVVLRDPRDISPELEVPGDHRPGMLGGARCQWRCRAGSARLAPRDRSG